MKKYIALTFLFLLVTIPATAKSQVERGDAIQAQQQLHVSGTSAVSPSGSQAQNRNQIQTQNQGEVTQVAVQNQEKEQLETKINENMGQVATQVQELIDTVGAKGGIG